MFRKLLEKLAGHAERVEIRRLRRERKEQIARRDAESADYRARWTGDARWCPVCERPAAGFAEFGRKRRKNARCPWCHALERHRFAWLYLTQRTDLFEAPPKRMLHFAPEPMFETLFRGRLGEGYMTADLLDPKADLQTDIAAIALPDDQFDMVYCSHVLEHVVEDHQAMREIWRVLKPGGWALVSVPIIRDVTLEDPSVVTPDDRARVFGHPEHVRIYGKDFVDRLREAGFAVDVRLPWDLYGDEERERMGLTKACGEIFVCRKTGAGKDA